MIKVLSLFSGIGAFERALCRIGLDWELVNYCEIDRWASLSYSMVNQCDESLNLHDVRAVTAETVRDRQVDLITYGFPCQDISIAGKQQGFVNNSGEPTRSGLFFDALRIIKELQPRYAIAENVKALTNKKFKNEFATVLSSLEDAGYNNYWSVLNAKDYGIPQNRERVFIVSIRKDVDKGDFQFPKKEPLKFRVKDILATDVDERYTISDALWEGHQKRKKEHKEKGNGFGYSLFNENSKYINTLSARYQKDGSEILIEQPDINPRKLTPKECWRLMGFMDEEFDRVHGISNSQLYKQAGNSIVVNVLSALLTQLFNKTERD